MESVGCSPLHKPRRTYRVRRRAPPLSADFADPDFALEHEGDVTAFLQTQQLPSSHDFVGSDGRELARRFVGPAGLLAAKTKAAPSRKTFVEKANTLTAIADPETRLQAKLSLIEEGKRRERLRESHRLHRMHVGQRFAQGKQTRILKNFTQAQAAWAHIEHSLSRRVNKPLGDLAATSGPSHRQKQEALERAKQRQTVREQTGDQAWYMTLRESDDRAHSHLRIGDLYTRVLLPSESGPTIIRKPGAPQAHTRTFMDTDFFKKTVAQSLVPPEPRGWESLSVDCFAKLPAELAAVERAGAAKLDLRPLVPQETPPDTPQTLAAHASAADFY